jgi:lactoylglutathione lyase
MFERIDYVRVMVTDMDRSIVFYRDLLGLRVRFTSPDWTELDTGHTTLALHAGAKQAGVWDKRLGGTASLGFYVKDVDAAARELRARGVRLLLEPENRPGEPIRLAVIADPDGLEINLTQLVRQPPRG